MTDKMQAWQFARPGPLESTLHLATIARPTSSSLKPDQLLIQTVAVGLNPADYKIAELGFVARAITPFPKTASFDISGVVVAVGQNVTDVQVDDHVAGRLDFKGGPGALAEYAVAERSHVAILPAGVDVVKAAGLPTGALTAYQTLVPYIAKDSDGHPRVFVNGGGGGVGCFSIQIAKLLGCHVTASCSASKADFCRSLGADDIVDYKATPVMGVLRAKGPVFDLCVDNVGNNPPDLYSAGNDYLRPGSPYQFVGGNMSLASAKNIFLALVLPKALGGSQNKFNTFMTKDSKDDLEQIVQWFAEGKLQVPVDSTFEFANAKAGMTYVKAGRSQGKVLVTI